jgi:chaperonin cofactor prefoldin
MKVDVKAAANKILANVEANERQIKSSLEKMEGQLKGINSQMDAMRVALREVEVLKCTLIHISCDPEVQRAVGELLKSTQDPAPHLADAEPVDTNPEATVEA